MLKNLKSKIIHKLGGVLKEECFTTKQPIIIKEHIETRRIGAMMQIPRMIIENAGIDEEYIRDCLVRRLAEELKSSIIFHTNEGINYYTFKTSIEILEKY